MNDREIASDGYIEKTVHVGRVAKTTKGGRKMSFVALIVVGDGKGKVGMGLGKAGEVPAAMKKASAEGRRNMRSIDLNGKTIWHEINQRFGATKVFMKPASTGTGVIAGHAMKAVFTVIGIEDVLSKVVNAANPINVVRATIDALTGMRSPELIASRRGKSIKAVVEG
jgi:small subunit ribosomal protein S5